MNATVSVVIQKKLPPKLKDPGSFSIPCTIGNENFENVMLDLGASINVMPYSLYKSMDLGELKRDNVVIQLADRSSTYPKGYVEDVLVRVNHLIFPADFYIIDMEDAPSKTSPILLGRPFMRTARTKIDVYSGTLTMEFDGDTIGFNILEAMRYPISETIPCYSIDVIDSLAQIMFESLSDNQLEYVISHHVGIHDDGSTIALEDLNEIHDENTLQTVAALSTIPSEFFVEAKTSHDDNTITATIKIVQSTTIAATVQHIGELATGATFYGHKTPQATTKPTNVAALEVAGQSAAVSMPIHIKLPSSSSSPHLLPSIEKLQS